MSAAAHGLTHASTAAVAAAIARVAGSRGELWIEVRRFSAVSAALWTFDSARAVGTGARPPTPIAQRIGASLLVKGLRR